MASFTDLVAGRVQQRRKEFLASLSSEPQGSLEAALENGLHTLWHPLDAGASGVRSEAPSPGSVAAVDGSRAVRALNSGADWVVAQALLVGPHGPAPRRAYCDSTAAAACRDHPHRGALAPTARHACPSRQLEHTMGR